MELFKINEGPWEKLFEGIFGKNEVNIFSNPESTLLVLIFEKQGSKVEGVVLELFKVFSAQGEVEGFIETLPREIILLLKHDKRETSKFLLVGSTPSYSEWTEEPFSKEFEILLKKIKNSAVILQDISKAYDIQVTEIKKAPLKERKKFFSETLWIPVISSQHPGTQSETTPTVGGDFMVGLTKERNTVNEPLELFFTSLVTGGEKADRLHFLHILTESFLLSNTVAIIFDSTNTFKGLNFATKNDSDLQKYKVPNEPIGFPIKIFKPNREIKVDLNFINPEGFSETFGIGKKTTSDIIATTLMKNTVTGMGDLIEKIKIIPTAEDVNAYEVKRTVRILTLLNRVFPNLFEGKNDLDVLTASGTRNFGRAEIIDLKGIEPKLTFLICHNILSALLKYYREKKDNSAKAMVIIPEINSLMQKDISPEMTRETQEIIKHLEKAGVGTSLSEENPIDIAPEIANIIQAKINVSRKNDVAVQLKGRKGYRVFLRPALSARGEE